MQNLSKTGSYFGDPGGTYPPKLYLSTPLGDEEITERMKAEKFVVSVSRWFCEVPFNYRRFIQLAYTTKLKGIFCSINERGILSLR